VSADLLDQLAQYGADHRSRQTPVEMAEILRRADVHVEAGAPPSRTTGRSRLVIAAAAALILSIVGTLLLLDREGPSEPSDTPVTDVVRTREPTVPPSTAPPTTVADTQAADSAGVRLTIPASVTVGDPTPVTGTTYEVGMLDHGPVEPALGAWDDGFLLVSVTGGERMNAELSEEMFARLPIEVQEAYPNGIPGTLGEAITRLQEDGLLDEVQAALEADPELNEAVNSGPVTPVVYRAEFSTDGETWTPIDVVPPEVVDPHMISIVDGRLVVVGAQPPGPLASPEGVFGTLAVASTVDLAVWSVQTADVPDVVEILADVRIAMNGRGWVTHIEPDRRPGEAGAGFEAGQGPPLAWAAAWGGEPVPVDGAVLDEHAVVTPIARGFLSQHEDGVDVSNDGLAWAPVPEAPGDVGIVAALPLDDGTSVVVTWAATCETRFYGVDDAGHGWERIDLDIDDAPRGLLPSSSVFMLGSDDAHGRLSSSASLFDTSGPPIETWRWEQDGLALTLRACGGSDAIPNSVGIIQYELVETDTETTVLSESGDRWPPDDPEAFEHLTIVDDVVTVRDPASGEPMLVVSYDDAMFDVSGVRGAEDIWLLATVDGTNWLADALPTGRTGSVPAYGAAIRNGGTVLVASDTGWFRYELPGR
jgi:hypothetical protein